MNVTTFESIQCPWGIQYFDVAGAKDVEKEPSIVEDDGNIG